MDHSSNFISFEQIEKAVELSFNEIHEMLKSYIYFKGLVWHENELTYAEGYFVIEETEPNIYEFTREEIESDYHIAEPDTPITERLISIKGSEYSNKAELIDKKLKLKNTVDIEGCLYSYKELCQLMKKLGCPEPKTIIELSKRDYAYDVKLLNRKSNFTLEDAAKIAANINVYGFPPPSLVKNHYIELLSDCIKGTNQDGFKLHTVELWCSYNDEFGEGYSKSYNNGSYLKQTAELDYQLTIISKREFVRWCEYENIDTGLTIEHRDFEESIEALKAENNKLKSQLHPQQGPQPPISENQNNKIFEQLNGKIEQLNGELKSLRQNSFPVMTSFLKAALSAQKKYWSDYDINNLPLQKNIQQHIQEELNIELTIDNRVAKSLTVAILPEDIKKNSVRPTGL